MQQELLPFLLTILPDVSSLKLLVYVSIQKGEKDHPDDGSPIETLINLNRILLLSFLTVAFFIRDTVTR